MYVRVLRIAVDKRLYTSLNHGREEAGLSLERSFICLGKSVEVHGHDGTPAVVCGFCQRLYFDFVDVHARRHIAVGLTWLHGYHAQMAFQPSQYPFVVACLNLLWPKVVVVVMAAQSGDADSDGILSTADDTVFAFGTVLKAEH